MTAQKRVERLQDVPVPVTAMSAEALVNSQQLTLQDYYNKVPGLGLSLIGDGSAPSVVIRGITTGGLTNPTVGILIDDVPYGTTVVVGTAPSAPDIDPGDLARVEVLRGPQGTLYGASSIGGLINFVTIEPSLAGVTGRAEGALTSVSHGDDLGHSVRGSINLPLGDAFAIRASAFTVREPGYIDNVLTGEDDVNRRDSEGGRVAALWRFAENFSLKLSAMLQRSERLGTSDVDLALGSDEPQQRTVRGGGSYRRDTQAYSATVDGLLGGVDVKSITAYNVDEIGTRIDNSQFLGPIAQNGRPGSGFNGFGVSGTVGPIDRRIEKFSQEVRVSIPLGEQVDWLLGAFYTDEDVTGDQTILASDPASGNVAGTLYFAHFPNNFKEYAAFTNIELQLTERFDIQLGARFSENEQSFSTTRGGPLVNPLGFFGGVTSVPEVSGKDDAFTYLITPRLRVTPDMMIYARLASGYRPGGPNVACGTAGIPCQYKPDSTQNYEIGMKGSAFSGALSYDASVYRIDWKDIQISLSSGPIGFQDNATEAKSQGVELSLGTKPLKGLSISAWGAYNEAELTEPFPSNSSARGAVGDRLPYSSRVSGSLSLDHEFPVASSRATAIWGGSATYVGDRKGVFRGATQVRETFPSYTQVDLYAGVRVSSWTVRAFVNNVGDERGVLRGGLDSLNPTFVTYIEPRTVGLFCDKSF